MFLVKTFTFYTDKKREYLVEGDHAFKYKKNGRYVMVKNEQNGIRAFGDRGFGRREKQMK